MTARHPLLEPVRHRPTCRCATASPSRRCRVSAPRATASPTDTMAAYYAGFARGGFGLVISEGTYTDHAHSQAYADQPAIVTDAQVRAWARVADRAPRGGWARCSSSSCTRARSSRATGTRDVAVAPSAVQPKGRKLLGYGGDGPYAPPREMTAADIADAVAGVRGRRHASTNGRLRRRRGARRQRLPAGPVPDRPTRTAARTATAARPPIARACWSRSSTPIHAAAGADFPVGIRVSQVKVNDLEYRWSGPAEAEAVFASPQPEAGPAFIHVASEGAHWDAHVVPGARA